MADTIAAISTAGGVAAIGIVRLSGDDAIKIATPIFVPEYGGSIENARDRSLILGKLLDKDGQVIDVCLCTVSRAPNSYTGENTVEFQCHGSPLVLREALVSLFARGARQAQAGEFTKRAFLNGQLDLTQAEAVIDLIDAETLDAARNAAGQVSGAMLSKTGVIYDELADIAAHYSAVIDYPDEDIEDFLLSAYELSLNDIKDRLQSLLDTFERGRIIKDGVRTAIIGRPNVGKSSLLNALLGYDRAIVTEIPGTTRDTIEEKAIIGGVLLRLIDTAGIRETADPIESMGVERSLLAASEAELILAVFDTSEPPSPEDFATMNTAKAAPLSIAILNKSDLSPHPELVSLELSGFGAICRVSAATGEGFDALSRAVATMLPVSFDTVQGEMLTNLRQAQAVEHALNAIVCAVEALNAGMTPDAVLSDVEAAMSALGELTGRIVTDDVVDRIFERFCVGK